jgi:hypothetical protein
MTGMQPLWLDGGTIVDCTGADPEGRVVKYSTGS